MSAATTLPAPEWGYPTQDEYHAYLTRLAIEAGADPARARERMAQAATVYSALLAEAGGR